jgi:predicted MFS family arabinose efflux permease
LCPLRSLSDVTWRGVGVVSGWQVTASLCFYAIFAATAFVRESFGVSRTLVGVSLTATMAGYTSFLFLTGAAVDGYGERPVMVAGLTGLAAAMVGVALAPSYPLLLLALVLVGCAYATAMPSTNRAVLVVAPDSRRNLAMNVKQVGVTVGSGLGALLVTTAAGTRYGWRIGFGVAAVLATGVAVVFTLTYRGRAGSGELAPPNLRGLAGHRGYRPLVAAGFFFGAAVFTTTGYVVLHLTESVGAAAAFGGLVLASVQVTGSAGRLVGGSVADWLPGDDACSSAQVLVVQALCAVVAFGGVVAAATPPTAGVAFGVLGLFVLGFPGVYYACLTALVPDDQVGAATAGGQTALNLGGLSAPPVFGYLADTLSYDAGWTLLACCTFVAGALLVGLARDEHA